MERQKRLYAVVILLAVVTLGLLLLVWQAGMSSSGGAASAQSPPHLSQSAGEAWAVLQAWLPEHWAADGQAVACTITLAKSASMDSEWTFQVYSPQKNHLLIVVVRGQDVQVLRDVAALYRQAVLPDTAWRRDSQEVLTTWWRAGGAAAWNAATTSSVVMHLGLREAGVPSWQLTRMTEDLATLEYWEIRADTGALLEHSSTGGQ